MHHFEYRVIPAPARGEKQRGARTTEDRFSQTLAGVLNAQAREGWEYMRTDTLPSEERAGLTKRRTVYLNLLVFRRPLPERDDAADARRTLTATPPPGDAPRLQPVEPGAAPKLGPARDPAA